MGLIKAIFDAASGSLADQPVAMSYYWAVSSLVRIIQNILIDRFFLKD